jgi:hypothetical protein
MPEWWSCDGCGVLAPMRQTRTWVSVRLEGRRCDSVQSPVMMEDLRLCPTCWERAERLWRGFRYRGAPWVPDGEKEAPDA